MPRTRERVDHVWECAGGSWEERRNSSPLLPVLALPLLSLLKEITPLAKRKLILTPSSSTREQPPTLVTKINQSLN